MPSSDTIRSFRAQYRQFTYRAAKQVPSARLAAQLAAHLGSLKTIIEKLTTEFPDVLSNRRNIWNWNETAASGEYGREVKFFTSSHSTQGGAQRGIKYVGKHLKAGIAVAACHIATVAIQRLFSWLHQRIVMPSWLKPLDSDDFTSTNAVVHWLCKNKWFPKEAELFVTKHGSVDKKLIIKVMQHIH